MGHKQYSNLIRDCFLDINHVSVKYNAEIYQYVGDETVLSWLMNDHSNPENSINFYFATKDNFLTRKDYYLKEYGIMPEFRAGLHQGVVTCVEAGDIKREIAYHGDPLYYMISPLHEINDHEALKNEQDRYKEIPVVRNYLIQFLFRQEPINHKLISLLAKQMGLRQSK